jgi:polysaccharide pyruvyl transferase CsaB
MSRVLISGYIGFNNSGDEGILMAITQHLRALAPDLEITVLSRRPAETQRLYGTRAVHRFSPPAVVAAMACTDLLISGGGSLIQDVTSTRSLYYYLGIIELARRMGKKVVVYANGIGPVLRPMNRALTSRVLSGVDLITLRERGSLVELEGLGVVGPRVEVTADPVFGLQPATPAKAREILAGEDVGATGGLKVGVSVRRWQGLEGWAGAVAAVADRLVDEHGAQVVFLPMEFPGDVEACRGVAARMRRPAVILRGKYMADEYMALVGELDLLIGMRLHSLIFAARQEVPLVGLVYDPKVRGFLESIGQPAECDVRGLTAGQLAAAVSGALERREEIRQSLKAKVGPLAGLAVRNAELTLELLGRRAER